MQAGSAPTCTPMHAHLAGAVLLLLLAGWGGWCWPLFAAAVILHLAAHLLNAAAALQGATAAVTLLAGNRRDKFQFDSGAPPAPPACPQCPLPRSREWLYQGRLKWPWHTTCKGWRKKGGVEAGLRRVGPGRRGILIKSEPPVCRSGRPPSDIHLEPKPRDASEKGFSREQEVQGSAHPASAPQAPSFLKPTRRSSHGAETHAHLAGAAAEPSAAPPSMEGRGKARGPCTAPHMLQSASSQTRG